MKAVIAIDSFKGSLSTFEAGEAVSEALKDVYPEAEGIVLPIADGGEGTSEVLAAASGAKSAEASVNDPLGRKITAKYYVSGNKAIMEMAAASGLTLLSADERDPLRVSTFGVGEMIKDAISKGCREFIIGIGGSATNDGGTGMLKALGFEFLKENGEPVKDGAAGLKEIFEIRTENAIKEISSCNFTVACDVDNPLCGRSGASLVFGIQKGADEKTAEEMDGWMKKYAEISRGKIPSADPELPGSGAAGGLGFAFRTYLNAKLEKGINIVIRETGLEEHIKDADIVVTGEGRLDAQSVMGKVPEGVAKAAKKYKKTVVAFSGCLGEGAEKCNVCGIDAYFPILRSVTTLEEAMDKDNAFKNLKETAKQVFYLIKKLDNRDTV